MDLLSQIEARKKMLKATKTLLTNDKGERYEIFDGIERKLNEKCLPFVVDDKPDMEITEITKGLFLSSQDPVTSDELLKLHRIQHILSLGVKISMKQDGVNYYYLDFLDLPEFNISRAIEESFRLIHNCKGENILVHCNAGVSRSPTVVIAYLMACEKLSYDEAYERVKTRRNCVRPNDGFIKQLKDFSNSKKMIPNFSNDCTDENSKLQAKD